MNAKRLLTKLLVVLLLAQAARADDLEINASTFARWKKFIPPSKEELAFREIKWKPSLVEAVAEAKRTKKPILLWSMNGNPLSGCNPKNVWRILEEMLTYACMPRVQNQIRRLGDGCEAKNNISGI